MDNYTNESQKWMSLTESNNLLKSTSGGDFNSAELSQGLGHFTNAVAHHNTLSVVPSFGSPGSTSPEGHMPGAMPTPESGTMAAAPPNMPTPNAMMAQPQQMFSTDILNTGLGMAMAKMANPTIPTDPTQCAPYQMAKTYLSEPCPTSQPLNASLRGNSTGNYYFLPKQ